MKQIKECKISGATFEPRHGNESMCAQCREVVMHHRNRHIPEQYNNFNKIWPNVDHYEAVIRRNAIERAKHNDNIIGEGYAERQIADTLSKVEPIKKEL